MKKRAEFTHGAQSFITALLEREIKVDTHTEGQICQECGGGGEGCWCDRGAVEVLVVEWDEPDSNDRVCNCGSGRQWATCEAQSDYCG